MRKNTNSTDGASATLIGHKVKKLRELKNLTQEYMAAQLDMAQSGYSRIENNEVDITFSRLEKIAGVLELKPEEIIAFDETNVFNSVANQTTETKGLPIHNFRYSDELKKLSKKVTVLEKLIKKFKKKDISKNKM